MLEMAAKVGRRWRGLVWRRNGFRRRCGRLFARRTRRRRRSRGLGKAPSSRASWSNRSGSERGGSTRGDRPRAANPARRWAFGDEVKGKTDVFDRFMGSSPPSNSRAKGWRAPNVSTMVRVPRCRVSRSAPTGADTSFDDLIDEEDAAAAAADRDDEAPPREAAPRRPPAPSAPGTIPRDAIDGTFPREEHAEGPRLGALRVRLIGDAREGETLTLRVDSAAVPEGRGPLTLRWERGCARDGANGERSDAREDVSPATAFRTILGAKGASYTCTSADVGCVGGGGRGGGWGRLRGGLERVRVCADGREGDGTDVRRG